MKRLAAALFPVALVLAACSNEDPGNPGDDALLSGGSLIVVIVIVAIVVALVVRARR